MKRLAVGGSDYPSDRAAIEDSSASEQRAFWGSNSAPRLLSFLRRARNHFLVRLHLQKTNGLRCKTPPMRPRAR
uniref:Uncharacterized protein n=1 Tax=Sphaerodactylus townsendi TaxID=933632 RepID=A0ACB8EBM8_9SAUR